MLVLDLTDSSFMNIMCFAGRNRIFITKLLMTFYVSVLVSIFLFVFISYPKFGLWL